MGETVMKIRCLCVCLAVMLIVSGSALAMSLPGLSALSTVATNSTPTPLKLPDVFEIVYQTAEGEVSLRRDGAGSFTYLNGETKLVFTKSGKDAYKSESESGKLTFDEVCERIAPVWNLIAPNESAQGAVTVAFDRNVKVADRDANRFREAVHTNTGSGFSVESDLVVWYTFDKATGVCLAKETAPDENRDNVTVEFTCISYVVGK